MKNYLFAAIPLAILLISQGCKSKLQEPVLSGSISIEGERFIDDHKRQVILSGVNLVNKQAANGYIGPESEETFRNFKNWGFNVVRLGIIWDGVEPEPGVYNEEYLLKIDGQVKMAKDAGLFVFLDMHQDLFSVMFSDGAPAWATLTDDLPHYTGEIWSDAYLISPAVQTAFDNFWANKPASDGIGIQDHYKNAWKHIASRYAGDPTVIGYDVMNEPFPGSSANYFLPTMFGAYAKLIGDETGTDISIEDVAEQWSSQDTRYEALEKVSDKDRFSRVVDAVYNLNSEFESGALQDFYQGVANSIREVDSKKILFLEHSYFCNSGVATAINTVNDKDGNRDPFVAYAAHGYDLLVDTRNLENSSSGRLELIFSRIKESGERMGVPVLIGEWGALGGDTEGLTELARTNLDFFEKYGFSNTYWAYNVGTENREYFKKALVRAYPEYISGTLVSYSNDQENSRFICKWEEDANVSAPTQIYIPDIIGIENFEIIPESDLVTLIEISGSKGGYLVIPSSEKSLTREVTVNFSNSTTINLSSSEE